MTWQPDDDELDATARSLPAPEADRARAEQVRTALLASTAARAQLPRRSRMPVIAISVAAAATVLGVLWFSRGDHAPGSAAPIAVAGKRQFVGKVGNATFQRVSEWPDYVVRLDDGRITIEVATVGPDERFRVITADAEVEVRGTKFEVAATHGLIAEVVVKEGTVEVRADHKVVILHSGETWTAPRTASRDVIDLHPTQVAATDGAGSTETATGTHADAHVATDHSGTNAHATDTHAGNAHAADTRVTAGVGNNTHATALGTDAHTTGTHASDTHATNTHATDAHATDTHATDTHATDTHATARATTETHATDPQAINAHANDTHATDAHATDAHATDAHATDTHATDARPDPVVATTVATAPKPGEDEFRAGWTALKNGDPTGASKLFTTACGKAHDDAIGEDACFWAGAAAKRANDTATARTALARFVDRFPSSARAPEAAALLGWILYDAHDLDAAEKQFHKAEHDRVPKVRDSALKGLEAISRSRAN